MCLLVWGEGGGGPQHPNSKRLNQQGGRESWVLGGGKVDADTARRTQAADVVCVCVCVCVCVFASEGE